MYKEFALVDMEVNPTEKQIKLFFTGNVDPDTINSDTIAMVHAESQKIHRLKFRTSKKVVIITVLDEINPGEEYRLDINKTIKDIVGAKLQSSLIRHVYFNTNIYSNVRILSPANHELVDGTFMCEWQEILRDKRRKPILEYRLQIADNINFNPIEIDTVVVNKQRIGFPKLKNQQQYYIRIRVESGNEFGKWSDVATFTYDGPERVIDKLEQSEKNSHKIEPVSIFAPYNYKRNMHNNKQNLDTNPSSNGSMSGDEISNATDTHLLSTNENVPGSTNTALTPETIDKIMNDTSGGNTSATIRLADGTLITKASAGNAGVVVDETPAGQDIKPVVIQELKVVKRPRQGTNDFFVFEFDGEIKDENILTNIEIIRKDF
nr:MAG TPA: contactin-3 [Caudoviricetes sp.]